MKLPKFLQFALISFAIISFAIISMTLISLSVNFHDLKYPINRSPSKFSNKFLLNSNDYIQSQRSISRILMAILTIFVVKTLSFHTTEWNFMQFRSPYIIDKISSDHCFFSEMPAESKYANRKALKRLVGNISSNIGITH